MVQLGQQENATLLPSNASKSSEQDQRGFTLSLLHSDPGKIGPLCAILCDAADDGHRVRKAGPGQQHAEEE